jgi:hypothetical protein
VNDTVVDPVAPHVSDNALKSLLQDTLLEHVSDADAPALLASQLLNAEVFPEPSHSTVEPAADVVM